MNDGRFVLGGGALGGLELRVEKYLVINGALRIGWCLVWVQWGK